MKIQLTLNDQLRSFDCREDETLMALLRRSGMWSVKHGCESGECGACSVLVEGRLAPTCVLLAAQMEGHRVDTVEALDRGPGAPLHPIQQAFAETGAIQCGFCTPAMVLAAQELLGKTLTPSEAEIRSALGGCSVAVPGMSNRSKLSSAQLPCCAARRCRRSTLRTACRSQGSSTPFALPRSQTCPAGMCSPNRRSLFSPFRQSTPSPRPT